MEAPVGLKRLAGLFYFGGLKMKYWKILLSLFALLGDQKGQIDPDPDDDGDAAGVIGDKAPIGGDDDGQPVPDDGGKDKGDGDGFLSGSKRKAEIMALINGDARLKEAYGWMQGAYNKSLKKVKGSEEKIAWADKVNSDPTFAYQAVQDWAARNGYSISKAQAKEIAAAAGSEHGNGSTAAPQALVEAVRASLSPELQWMAPQIANAQYVAHQMTMKPIEEKQLQERRSEWNDQYDRAAEELGQVAPGWEEHEDDMNELLEFLRSEKVTHKKFGSKLAVLHGVVTGDARATQEAARRFARAATSRTVSGQSGRSAVPNVHERVQKAKTNSDAWDIAAKAAMEQAEKQGLRIR